MKRNNRSPNRRNTSRRNNRSPRRRNKPRRNTPRRNTSNRSPQRRNKPRRNTPRRNTSNRSPRRRNNRSHQRRNNRSHQRRNNRPHQRRNNRPHQRRNTPRRNTSNRSPQRRNTMNRYPQRTTRRNNRTSNRTNRRNNRTPQRRNNRTPKKTPKKPFINHAILSAFISTIEDTHMKKGKLFKMIDGHMVIDPPIAEKKHVGSCASEKNHYQHYTGTLNFLRFFKKISKKLPNKLLCFPELTGPTKLSYQIEIVYDTYLDYKAANINLPGFYFIKHYYHKLNIKKEIDLCIKKGCRFICLDIDLKLNLAGDLAHANLILIDTKEKTIELFEPHGGRDRLKGGWYKDISNIFKSYFETFYPNFKYIPPHKILPKDGPQSRIYGPFCISWCSLYLHYKLLNKDVPSKTIIKRILQLNKTFLLRYVQYVEDMIKGNIKDYQSPIIVSENDLTGTIKNKKKDKKNKSF